MWISKLCKYANPQDCGLSQAGRYVEQHGATQALSCEARQVHRSVKTHGPVASCASTVCGSMQVHEKGASQIFACSGTTQNCIECGDTQTHTLPTLGTSETFKLGCQFRWTNVVLLSFECPSKTTGGFAGHLTQLSCTPLQPCLLHPVQHRRIAQLPLFLDLMHCCNTLCFSSFAFCVKPRVPWKSV